MTRKRRTTQQPAGFHKVEATMGDPEETIVDDAPQISDGVYPPRGEINPQGGIDSQGGGAYPPPTTPAPQTIGQVGPLPQPPPPGQMVDPLPTPQQTVGHQQTQQTTSGVYSSSAPRDKDAYPAPPITDERLRRDRLAEDAALRLRTGQIDPRPQSDVSYPPPPLQTTGQIVDPAAVHAYNVARAPSAPPQADAYYEYYVGKRQELLDQVGALEVFLGFVLSSEDLAVRVAKLEAFIGVKR